jgi:hypothetical protein
MDPERLVLFGRDEGHHQHDAPLWLGAKERAPGQRHADVRHRSWRPRADQGPDVSLEPVAAMFLILTRMIFVLSWPME